MIRRQCSMQKPHESSGDADASRATHMARVHGLHASSRSVVAALRGATPPAYLPLPRGVYARGCGSEGERGGSIGLDGSAAA